MASKDVDTLSYVEENLMEMVRLLNIFTAAKQKGDATNSLAVMIWKDIAKSANNVRCTANELASNAKILLEKERA